MTKLSFRQADAIPAINSSPAEGASFPNYSLGGSGPSRETGGALIVLWKGSGTGATCRRLTGDAESDHPPDHPFSKTPVAS